MARGPAFLVARNEVDVPRYSIAEKDLEEEAERFEEALIQTRSQILHLRQEVGKKLGESEAQIFDAHLLVIEDKALIDETLEELRRSLRNVEHCFSKVSQRYIEFFDSVDDEYLRERLTDIRDVSRRILQNLLGQSDGSATSRLSDGAEPHIIVSSVVNASDIASIGRDKILGFVSSLGGRTSHAAIMARSLEVPAVVGLPEAAENIKTGDPVLVDGYDGVVIVHPSEETLYRYGQIAEQRKSIREMYRSRVKLPSDTKDGTHVVIRANIEGAADLSAVEASNAEGVGLFRTEAIFLREKGFTPEEEQFEEYKAVVKGVNPQPVTIRTLDIGGDKALPGGFVDNIEDNPFMGFRAIRFCLKNPDIFKSQLRAILRASAFGKAKILYPMISGVRELIEANELLEEAKQELTRDKIAFDEEIEVGCMIEIPSAAYTTDILADHCDFLSIGTNDLIQYLLAVDRVNDRIAHLYEPSHPAVIRTLKLVLDYAAEREKPVSICGEMAGDPIYASLLIGLGASDLSMTPSLIPEIKFMIRHFELQRARELAEEVIHTRRPRHVFSRLKEFYQETIGAVAPKILETPGQEKG